MNFPIRPVLFAICVLFLAVPATALERSTVERWITALDAVNTWAVEHDPRIRAEIRSLTEPRDVNFDQVWSEGFLSHPAVRDRLGRHGFDDPEAWNAVSGRVLAAVLALEMQQALVKAREYTAEDRERIANHPDIDPEDKQQMFEQMDAQLARLRALAEGAPESDIAAVRHVLGDFERIVAARGE